MKKFEIYESITYGDIMSLTIDPLILWLNQEIDME